jgi:hypothetical protein
VSIKKCAATKYEAEIRSLVNASVAEVPIAGEYHRDAALVGCGNDFVVTHTAAGLDHRDRAGVDHNIEAISEREERI